MHKDFLYFEINFCTSSSAYHIPGKKSFLPTVALANRWSVLMKMGTTKIALVAKESVDGRLRESLRRWKLAIDRQKREMQLMWEAEIFSFV